MNAHSKESQPEGGPCPAAAPPILVSPGSRPHKQGLKNMPVRWVMGPEFWERTCRTSHWHNFEIKWIPTSLLLPLHSLCKLRRLHHLPPVFQELNITLDILPIWHFLFISQVYVHNLTSPTITFSCGPLASLTQIIGISSQLVILASYGLSSFWPLQFSQKSVSKVHMCKIILLVCMQLFIIHPLSRGQSLSL